MQRLFLASIATMLISSVHAQDITRDELKRSNLTGKEMNVIVTVVTVPPGGHLPRHTHPGEEVVYVIEGATLELPDGARGNFLPEQRQSIFETSLMPGSRLLVTRL